MDILSAIEDCRSKYQVLGTVYSSKFLQEGGENYLYQSLKECYKPNYEPNEKILVIQDCNDVYEYQDLPGKFLTALQKCVWTKNISNCFVLLLTANLEIDNELEKVRQIYSQDPTLIQYKIVAGDYKKTLIKQDSFCVMPWVHLYVGPDGNVLPCCVADQKFPMGNTNQQSLNNIINSEQFITLRSNMLNGLRSKECRRCYEQENLSLKSLRHSHNSRWPDVVSEKLDPSGKIQNFQPRYLDIRLNNICNLKCRMCSGYYSSAIAQEEVELFGLERSDRLPISISTRQSIMSELTEYLPNCEEIYFAGGEPLITPEHYQILDNLIACNNTNLKIIYNTNFTNLTYKNKNVLDLWKNFSTVEVNASLDAQGAVAEYVRHGSQWHKIENNLEQLKQHCSHVKFRVTSTVGLLNVSSLLNLQKQWHQTGKLNINQFSLSVMIGPPHLTLTCLPLHHKQRLEKLVEQHIKWCQANGADKLANQWNDVVKYMWSSDNQHYLAEFRRLTHLIDQHRNESLLAVLPEYQDLI